jgi:hypothetical protein
MVPPIYLHALLSKIRDCGLATASVIAWPFDPLARISHDGLIVKGSKPK